MIKGFDDFVFEGLGANSMEPDPLDTAREPDDKLPNALVISNGGSGQAPSHWNNSPFLSGGRLTSAFGANPKADKRRVKTYREFVEATKNEKDAAR